MKFCLIIDTSPVIRKVCKCLLESIGYITIEAETGADGIERCRAQMPDAILVDWDLADMSGFDFLIEFRKNFDLPKMPDVVYMTTENDPVDIGRALSSGASAHLIKPFTRAELEMRFKEQPPVVAA